MVTYDSNGNSIEATWFETELSKCIIEQHELYDALYKKINTLILQVIRYNENNKGFQRRLFASITSLQEKFPGYTNVESILDGQLNIFVVHHFHKAFFEYLLPIATLPKELKLSKDCSVIKPSNMAGEKKNWLVMLDSNLLNEESFSNKKRGRVLLEDYSNVSMINKFGIMSPTHTPHNLQKYFEIGYERLQDQIKADETSAIVKWMRANDLPFISGISGTTITNLVGITQLIKLTEEEIRLYCMTLAACMVARGYHSFTEVFKSLELIGYKIELYTERQKYYEQFLTDSLIKSEIYQDFIENNSRANVFLKQPMSAVNFTLAL